jgi:hypothetical protein
MEIVRRRFRMRLAAQGFAGVRQQCAVVNREKFGMTRAGKPPIRQTSCLQIAVA